MITPGWIDYKISYRDVEIPANTFEGIFRHDKIVQRRIQLSFIYPDKRTETYNTILNNKTVFDVLTIILKSISDTKELYA